MSSEPEVTGEIENPTDEWNYWLRKVASYQPSHQHDMTRARKFVLVTVFGDMEKYHHDAEFHAKVHVAENLLHALDKAAQSGRLEQEGE